MASVDSIAAIVIKFNETIEAIGAIEAIVAVSVSVATIAELS